MDTEDKEPEETAPEITEKEEHEGIAQTNEDDQDQLAPIETEALQEQDIRSQESEQTSTQRIAIPKPVKKKDVLSNKKIKKLTAKVAKLKKSNKENRALIRDLRDRVQQLEERAISYVPIDQRQQPVITYSRSHKRKERNEEGPSELETAAEASEGEHQLHETSKKMRHEEPVQIDATSPAGSEPLPLNTTDDPSKYPIFPPLIMATNADEEEAVSIIEEDRMIQLKLPGSVLPGSPGTMPDKIPAHSYWQDLQAPETEERPFLKMVQHARETAALRMPANEYYPQKALLDALHKLREGKPKEWYTNLDHHYP